MEALMLGRRAFLKGSGASAAVLMALPTLATLEGCDTSWITIAINDVPTVVNIANSILAIVALGDPALTPAIVAAINLGANAVVAGLAVVQQLITSYQASPSDTILQKIDAALTDVQTNLSAILAAAHIDNAALQATIATGVSLAISVISAIQLLVPVNAQSSVMTASKKVSRQNASGAVPQKIKVLDYRMLAMMYNVVAASNGYGANVIK